MSEFIQKYLAEFCELVAAVDEQLIEKVAEEFRQCKARSGKVIVVGNGGSAAIAGHLAVDLTKAAKIKAVCFNESSLITCFANDYGYENWVVEALKAYCEKIDLVVLISSSGESPNILNAADWCAESKINSICLSGFDSANKLRRYGQPHLWVNANCYNYIENVHQVWLLAAVDRIVNDKF